MTTACMQHAWECTSTSIHDFVKTIVDTTAHIVESTQNFIEERRPGFMRGVERIQEIVMPILATIGGALLFAAQSSMFAIGFLVSVMNPLIMKGSLDRIFAIWSKQHPVVRCAIIAGAVVAWPISLAASAFFLGGHIGLYLQPKEEASVREPNSMTMP